MTLPCPAPRVLVGALFRDRGAAVTFTSAPPPEPLPVVRRPAKVARMLALAHHIQRAIDAGTFADRADVAARLGLTRARITQVLDLVLLAPDIQAQILELEAVDGVELLSEHSLRGMTRRALWSDQRALWAAVCPAPRT